MKDEVFPEMFRHTFPEVILTNRSVLDERNDLRKQLNYAFVYGMRYCVSIYRCRESLKEVPLYVEYLSKLIKLREEFGEFFYYGKFVVETDIDLPEGIMKAEYINGIKHLFIFGTILN